MWHVLLQSSERVVNGMQLNAWCYRHNKSLQFPQVAAFFVEKPAVAETFGRNWYLVIVLLKKCCPHVSTLLLSKLSIVPQVLVSRKFYPWTSRVIFVNAPPPQLSWVDCPCAGFQVYTRIYCITLISPPLHWMVPVQVIKWSQNDHRKTLVEPAVGTNGGDCWGFSPSPFIPLNG